MEIEERKPLFYTDYVVRWTKKSLHKMFLKYKKQAGIQKKGGVHVFGRHTPATMMVANGCDIWIIKEILRYRAI